jgi:uncharacterized protein
MPRQFSHSSTRHGSASMAKALEERRRERERLLGLARDYVSRLRHTMPLVAAVVVGSVARGDFNVWSDVDVVVVADELPPRIPDRAAMLVADAPPGLQPVGYTPAEFDAAWDKRNPLVREATAHGVILFGEEFLRQPRG